MKNQLTQVLISVIVGYINCNTSMQQKLNQHLIIRSQYQATSYIDQTALVTLQMETLGIDQVKELQNIISVKNVYILSWTDPRLSWDPKQYGGIQSISLPINRDQDMRIWIPDICVFQARQKLCIDSSPFDLEYAYIQYNGNVLWKKYMQNELIKSISFKYFPYDQQKIKMNILPWVYNTDHMFITIPGNRTTIWNYQMIQKWKIQHGSNHTINQIYKFGIDNKIYQKIIFQISVSRQFDLMTYYVIPTILIVMTSFSTFLIRHSFDIQLDKSLKAVFSVLFLQNLIKQYVEYSNEKIIILEFGFDLFYINNVMIILQIVSHFYRLIYRELNQEKQQSSAQIKAQELSNLRKSTLRMSMSSIGQSPIQIDRPTANNKSNNFKKPDKIQFQIGLLQLDHHLQDDNKPIQSNKDNTNAIETNHEIYQQSSSDDDSFQSVSERKTEQIKTGLNYMSFIKNMESVQNGHNLRLSTLKCFEREQLNQNKQSFESQMITRFNIDTDLNDIQQIVQSSKPNTDNLFNMNTNLSALDNGYQDIKEKDGESSDFQQSQSQMVQAIDQAIGDQIKEMNIEKRKNLSRRVTFIDDLSERKLIFKEAILEQRKFFSLRYKILDYKYLDLIIFTVIICIILGVLSYHLNKLEKIYLYYSKQSFKE